MRKHQRFEVHTRRSGLVALAIAGALIATSCGSSSSKAAPTTAKPADATTKAPTAATTAAPAPAAGGKSVTDYVAYTGGKAGAADKAMAPIKIGYVGQEGGEVVVSATNDDGVTAAVKFINEKAGGIGGHPVEIVPCYIARSDEEGQKCGQQMANDKDIKAIVLGPIVFGVEPFYAAIGAKPVISGVSVNGIDLVKPNAAVLFGGAQYILAPYGTFARDVLKVKKAALIYEEAPGTDLPAKGQADGFKAAGIDIKVVPYATGAPDLSVALQAAGATTADIVMPVINPPDCVKFQKAIEQLKIPDEKILASPVCIGAFGDLPQPKWIYAVASSQAADATDPAVPPYQAVLKEQGKDKAIGDPWVTVGFGQMMTVAKFLNGAGADKLNDASITAQVKAFKGPLILGSPVLACGKYPKAPGVCNDLTQFYKHEGNFVFKKVGDWVPPPAGWAPSN
jgi:branched-chain amino acid transport system substrate-binding protein